ncbi:MAG: hypothetical protein KAS07_02300, partial [Candidatus Pacebacteria bacterium]|nr:hypothetical protein [Candidatus Paceibacterota bacterium]
MEEKKDIKNTPQQPDVADVAKKTETPAEGGEKKIAPKAGGEKSTGQQDKKKGFFQRGGPNRGRGGKPGGRRPAKGRGFRGERAKPEFDQ